MIMRLAIPIVWWRWRSYLLKNFCMPDIRLVTKKISIPELKEIAEERFGDMVKAVADISGGVLAIGGEMHADAE